MDVSLDENAAFTHTQTVFGHIDHWFFDAFRATLKKHSRLQCHMATSGSKTVRHSYKVALNGENAEADLKGIWMLSGRRQSHVHVQMEHHAPECRSMQLFKGINADASQSSFEGKILVQPEAQRTQAYQLNNNMLLGEYALANSKPNLEIFADDVKASHGATVAKLDPSQLFYLKTRGLSEPLAKALLLQGFCREIIDAIPSDSLRNDILGFVEKTLKAPV
jgi:Fe-S cluster assembly protein SufD